MMFEIKTEPEDQTVDELMLDDSVKPFLFILNIFHVHYFSWTAFLKIQIKEESEDSDENEFAHDGQIDLFKRFRFRLTSKNTFAFPHHVVLSLNSHDDFLNLDNVEEVYKPLAYCDSYPKPYCSCADNRIVDPCLQLVEDKKSWNIRIMNFQKYCKNLRSMFCITL